MKFKPADAIQDLQYFGEYGGVNPSISDSSTYTFLSAKTMSDTFQGDTDGCYLYSRHTSPSNLYLGKALAALEGTESAAVTASGMGAITSVLLQLAGSGDHIISSRTVYGGTYAFMKNFMHKLGIEVTFVDSTDLLSIKKAVRKNTKLIYCETVSNPLLEITDIPSVAKIAHDHKIPLIVDNTFSPLSVAPAQLGADVVIHSLTKYINGASDTVGGVICGSSEFIMALKSVQDGAVMLLGPTMDSLRAASILKNLRTLHVRMKQHSHNAGYLAEHFEKDGLRTIYPGLASHKQHKLYTGMMNKEFGYGGMMTLDAGSLDKANALMEDLQRKDLGYLAVSLGFYKTLFTAPGSSTSSEISEEEQKAIGLTDGLIRFSIGLDDDIERTYKMMHESMIEIGVL